MFARSLQVKLVKTPKTQSKIEPPVDKTAEYTQIARETAAQVTKGVVVVTAVYVGADTIRRVAIVASQHILYKWAK